MKTSISLVCAGVALACAAGCSKENPAPAPSASAPAASAAAASGSSKVATAPAAAPAASTAQAASAGERTFASGAEFLSAMKLPVGSSAAKMPGDDGFGYSGPKDVKWPSAKSIGGKTRWEEVSFGGGKMALLMASPEQDQGEQCKSSADMKAKIGAAKVITEATYEVPPLEKGGTTLLGDTIELLVFEKDGKRGFYAHKVFDHGDDSTHVCCTGGPASGAKNLATFDDAAKVDAMVGVCMSVTFTF